MDTGESRPHRWSLARTVASPLTAVAGSLVSEVFGESPRSVVVTKAACTTYQGSTAAPTLVALRSAVPEGVVLPTGRGGAPGSPAATRGQATAEAFPEAAIAALSGAATLAVGCTAAPRGAVPGPSTGLRLGRGLAGVQSRGFAIAGRA